MKLRGSYHTHSRYSHDGVFTLEELKRSFREKGYDFVIMTEHAEDLTTDSYETFYKECETLSDDSFLFIPGLEVPYEGRVHVGCFPSASTYDRVPLYHEGITYMRNHGAISIFHHPSKQGYYMNETFRTLLDGIEIWNSRYEGRWAPSMRTMQFARQHFLGTLFFGGLDLHKTTQFGGPAITLDVSAFTIEFIIDALKKNKFALQGKYFTYTKAREGTMFHILWYSLLRIIYVSIGRVRDKI